MAKTDKFVEIKYNRKQLRSITQQLQTMPKKIPTVMMRGINRTIKPALSETAKRLAGEVNITKAAVRKRIVLSKATKRDWRATLRISRRRIRLIDWKARQTKKGVSYSIERGKRVMVPGSFIATVLASEPQGEHKGVFKRVGATQFPIVQLRGPSLGEVFKDAPMIVQQVMGFTGKKLVVEIDKQIKYALGKWRASA